MQRLVLFLGCLIPTVIGQCTDGLATKEVTSILNVHNNLRANISSGKFVAKTTTMPSAATAIANMTWDCKLEAAAAATAAGCKIVANTKKSIGQNVYFYNGTAALSSTTGQIASAAAVWIAEFTKFGWPSVNYTSTVAALGISEATQMAWAKSKKVGCSAALCNSKKSALVVCNYKAAGNKLNKNVYVAKTTSG